MPDSWEEQSLEAHIDMKFKSKNGRNPFYLALESMENLTEEGKVSYLGYFPVS